MVKDTISKTCREHKASDLWRKTEHGREWRREYARKYRESHKERLNAAAARYARKHRGTEAYKLFEMKSGPARKAVRQAIINWFLRPLRNCKCECGRQAQQYHHHKGYAKEHWTDVVPVCARCHKRLHLQAKRDAACLTEGADLG